jgi:hypothetical protein
MIKVDDGFVMLLFVVTVMKVSVMFEIMILLMVWILNCDMGFVT